MALNLWSLGGLSTSFNPLITGYTSANRLTLGIGDYLVKFKAKSPSNSTVSIIDAASSVIKSFNLTNVLTEYSFEFRYNKSQFVYIKDLVNVGDIIIEDIELVEKPLPSLTINGIDGFLSGKWTIHANATVIDNETLELNASGSYQSSNYLVSVNKNTDYYFSCEGASFRIYGGDSKTWIGSWGTDRTFNTGDNISIEIRVGNTTETSGKFTFKRPMLNLGSTPVPYEKKKGDRMVLPVPKKNLIYYLEQGSVASNLGNDTTLSDIRVRTPEIPLSKNVSYTFSAFKPNVQVYIRYRKMDESTGDMGTWFDLPKTVNLSDIKTIRPMFRYSDDSSISALDINPQLEEGSIATPYEPYSVQLNDKPKVKVAGGKNIFNGLMEDGIYTTSDGGKASNSSATRNIDYIPVKPSTTYAFSVKNKSLTDTAVRIFEYGENKTLITNYTNLVFTTNSNTRFINFHANKTSIVTTDFVQLEEGTTPTPYEPYKGVVPKAKNGLVMDGKTNYVQLPSMTMDAIEIDCLIDSSNPINKYIVDMRTGLTNGYVYSLSPGVGNGILEIKVDGANVSSYGSILKDKRIKIFAKGVSVFTDDVTIFGFNLGSGFLKGVLYGVRCYLNGEVVAEYDFTNPNNIVGDKVFQKGKGFNLIPPFTDSRWELHPNAKILGKDVMRLDSTSTGQVSKVKVTTTPQTNYLIKLNHNAHMGVYKTDLTTSVYGYTVLQSLQFNSGAESELSINLRNSSAVGTFDFIKPQLYELDGTEATLYGTPEPLLKSAKRVLYAKR